MRSTTSGARTCSITITAGRDESDIRAECQVERREPPPERDERNHGPAVGAECREAPAERAQRDVRPPAVAECREAPASPTPADPCGASWPHSAHKAPRAARTTRSKPRSEPSLSAAVDVRRRHLDRHPSRGPDQITDHHGPPARRSRHRPLHRAPRWTARARSGRRARRGVPARPSRMSPSRALAPPPGRLSRRAGTARRASRARWRGGAPRPSTRRGPTPRRPSRDRSRSPPRSRG